VTAVIPQIIAPISQPAMR